ncbi:MAG: histidine phosphatase family protein [Anaerolineaceae bacterium]
MQLYFIRHGQSTNNAIWETNQYNMDGRVADPPLTEKGFRQAELTAELLSYKPEPKTAEDADTWDPQNRKGFHLTHLYCSLMERAIQTGIIIAHKTGLPLVGLTDIHEIGGIYHETTVGGVSNIEVMHGLTRAELDERYPTLNLHKPIPDHGWWVGGKEELAQRPERAKRVLQFLKDHHSGTDDRVGIVTHGSFSAYIFRLILNLNLAPNIDFITRNGFVSNNCGITRIDQYGQDLAMLYYNRVDHLPDDLVT